MIGSQWTPFSFKDPRQERVYRRLALLGPGPAAFWLDACRLMSNETAFSSTSHLVGHLFREIESALCDVVGAIVLDPSKSKDGHKAKIQSILIGLEIPETDPLSIDWLRHADSASDYALFRKAHRDNLAAPRCVDDKAREHWRRFEAILDVVLERFESRYLLTHDLLDRLVQLENPDGNDADKLIQRCPNNFVSLKYFFDQLNNPQWVCLLDSKGYLSNPPEPEVDVEGKWTRCPPWAPGEYLKRMASVVPEQVRDVILKIRGGRNGE